LIQNVKIMKPPAKEYNFIVIGSGPGGATVAKELSLKFRS
jgi:choline dehydrogenase-like flavoprotein